MSISAAVTSGTGADQTTSGQQGRGSHVRDRSPSRRRGTDAALTSARTAGAFGGIRQGQGRRSSPGPDTAPPAAECAATARYLDAATRLPPDRPMIASSGTAGSTRTEGNGTVFQQATHEVGNRSSHAQPAGRPHGAGGRSSAIRWLRCGIKVSRRRRAFRCRRRRSDAWPVPPNRRSRPPPRNRPVDEAGIGTVFQQATHEVGQQILMRANRRIDPHRTRDADEPVIQRLAHAMQTLHLEIRVAGGFQNDGQAVRIVRGEGRPQHVAPAPASAAHMAIHDTSVAIFLVNTGYPSNPIIWASLISVSQ